MSFRSGRWLGVADTAAPVLFFAAFAFGAAAPVLPDVEARGRAAQAASAAVPAPPALGRCPIDGTFDYAPPRGLAAARPGGSIAAGGAAVVLMAAAEPPEAVIGVGGPAPAEARAPQPAAPSDKAHTVNELGLGGVALAALGVALAFAALRA